MTSSALVPFTFSLLKLPLVALQNVADDLNPHEIYNFSRVSKKTKNLARALSKKAGRLSFSLSSGVTIQFNGNEKWVIMPAFLNRPEIYLDLDEDSEGYAYFSKKPPSELLRLLERVIDLFKNSTIRLDFDTEYSTRHDFISYFNWFVENPSTVPYVEMKCSHAEGVQFFVENYKKPSKKLYLVLDYGNEEELELSDNLETNIFEEVVIDNSHPVNFNLYNVFSCPIIDSYEKHFTNQDLNTFIKNWQSGLTNSHWRSVCIKISEPIKLQDVLKDITVTYRDPRTEKRQVSVGYESYWIFGGIDIQKHDGTVTATIQWKDYRVNSEDSEVPIKLIRKYEGNNGVIFDEEDELEEDQHDEVQHEEFQLEEEQLEEDELVENQLEDDEHEEDELQAADLHANFMRWLKRFSQAEFSMYIW